MSQPQSIGSLLAELPKCEVSAAEIWDKEIAIPGTRVTQIRRGLLTIECASSCALFELKGFRQAEIISRLRHASVPIMASGIRFELVGAA